jgi:hypothetical protein
LCKEKGKRKKRGGRQRPEERKAEEGQRLYCIKPWREEKNRR